MYKQIFINPLRSKTPSLKCGHNAFTHHTFPRLVREQGLTLIEELEHSPIGAESALIAAFTETNTTYPLADRQQILALRDISLFLDAIEENPLVVLSLTPPKERIGVSFIGLLTVISPSSPLIRYFTLERATSKSTALCEWALTPSGPQHRYLGVGPKPKPETFIEAIARHLEFEASTALHRRAPLAKIEN